MYPKGRALALAALMIKGGRLSPNAHAGTALGLIAHENKRSLKGTLIHAP